MQFSAAYEFGVAATIRTLGETLHGDTKQTLA